MATYIRLTDYKSSDEKEQEFFKSDNRYEAKQEDFSKIPSTPVAYWLNNKASQSFENGIPIGDVLTFKQGIATSDNERFLKYWQEVNFEDLDFSCNNPEELKYSQNKWFPYNKGGSFQKWYGNNEYIVNWENNGQEMKDFTATLSQGTHVRLKSKEYYCLPSITYSSLSSGDFGCRYSNRGFLFDTKGSCIFGDVSFFNYSMSLLNSKVAKLYLDVLCPTLDYNMVGVKQIPTIYPKENSNKQKVETLTQQNIGISKEEWDSRETSWDFAQNEILRILNDEFFSKRVQSTRILNAEKPTLETVYTRYCEYWREKFFQLHVNEEELNRLFIDIYELQDELTPDVELKDITILKSETKIVENKLVFLSDEIMKQFISYGVGVMFGRYSLDHHGLHVANMNENLDDANSKFNIQNSTFLSDDDNVIPVLEDDYFKDDMSSRFVQFVKATFGQEHLSENIRFIENSLGTTLRKYFVKGFYEDHIKRYKKRPIYWMVASPKKGFMSLIYMHRYTSDIFATVQNGYLREYITKLEVNAQEYQRESDDSSNSSVQRDRASKEVDKINKTMEEVIKFDRESLTKFAQESIEIDLDDGVKVNYCKFSEVLYPISGLCK
jgi:hypothetical protein